MTNILPQEDFILFMFAGLFSACMSVNYLHVWCLQGPEESILSPGTKVTGGCEPLRGY